MSDLVKEYRPTMDAEVLHAWAQDAVKEIQKLGLHLGHTASDNEDLRAEIAENDGVIKVLRQQRDTAEDKLRELGFHLVAGEWHGGPQEVIKSNKQRAERLGKIAQFVHQTRNDKLDLSEFFRKVAKVVGQ